MFYDNFKAACERKGTTITAVLADIGRASGNTGGWKMGKFPRLDIVMEIAEYLQISIEDKEDRLYENNIVGKWIKSIIFNNANPLRHCPIRLVKVDVEKARVRFEADIIDMYRNNLFEPNGINEPDDWEQNIDDIND